MMTLIFICVVYSIMMGVTIILRNAWLSKKAIKETPLVNDVNNLLTGMLWPIYLPIAIMAITDFKIPKFKTKKSEIASDVPCPIEILIDMTKSSLLRDFKYGDKTAWNHRVKLHAYQSNVSYSVQLVVGSIELDHNDLTAKQMLDLMEFIKKLEQIHKEREKAEELAKSRSKALDGIETLLSLDGLDGKIQSRYETN